MWEPRRLTTQWAFTAYYRDSLIFTFLLFCRVSACNSLKAKRRFGRINLVACFILIYYVAYSSALKMEATCSSWRTIRPYIPEDRNHCNHRCENIKSCALFVFVWHPLWREERSLPCKHHCRLYIETGYRFMGRLGGATSVALSRTAWHGSSLACGTHRKPRRRREDSIKNWFYRNRLWSCANWTVLNSLWHDLILGIHDDSFKAYPE
jgi:hypothetical protein